MTTGMGPVKRFTGLENLRVDPKRGLILPVRTPWTPYEFTKEVLGEEISREYQQMMTEDIKGIRYILLHRNEYPAGRVTTFNQQTMALAMPEWFGGQAPSKEEYPDDYKPAPEYLPGWLSPVTGLDTSRMSVYEAYGSVQGVWGKENPFYEQGVKEFGEQALENMRFPFQKGEPQTEAFRTIIEIGTVTPDIVNQYPGTVVGDRIATLSTGEIIPVSDETAAFWGGAAPPPPGVSLPPGSIYLGRDKRTGGVTYLPADTTRYALKAKPRTKERRQAELDEIDRALQENVARILDENFPTDDDVEQMRWMLSSSPENVDSFLDFLASTGKTYDTVRMLIGLYPGITIEEINQFFPRTLSASERRTIEAFFAQGHVIDSMPLSVDEQPKATVMPPEKKSWFDRNMPFWSDVIARGMEFLGKSPVVEGYKTIGKTSATKSFVAGVGDVISTAGGTARWLGLDEPAAGLSTLGGQLQNMAPPDDLGDFDIGDLGDPDWWATKPIRMIPFALSLAPLAVGGFYGSAGVAAAFGAGKVLTMILGSIGGAALSRPVEAALEAGGVYDDMIAKGRTEAEAKKAADETFRNNTTLAGLDAFQIGIALMPTPGWVPKALVESGIARVVRAAGKMIIVGLTEGGEEGYQDILQRRAKGEEVKLDPVMAEQIALGAIMGLGMGFGGDVISSVVARSRAKMADTIEQQFEADVAAFIAQGDTRVQAELKALENTLETAEGMGIVERAIADVRRTLVEMHKEERGSLQFGEEPEVTPEVTTTPRGIGRGIPLSKMDKTDFQNWVGNENVVEGKIKVYRGVRGEPYSLRRGDFVTTNREYAKTYGENITEHNIPIEELNYFSGVKGGDPELLGTTLRGSQPTELIYTGGLIPKAEAGMPAIVQAAKEPWQMTREEFKGVASPIDLVQETGEKLSSQISQGKSGYSIERLGKENKFVEAVVFRDEQGLPRGVVGRGEDGSLLVYVEPEFRKKGIASGLYDFADKHGFDLSQSGQATSTKAAGFVHKRLVKQAISEGKPVPPEVLKDYPDLAKAIPKAEIGMPEAGLQPSMIPEQVAAKEVFPKGKGVPTQISMDEAARLEAMQAEEAGLDISRKQMELEGLKDWVQSEPAAKLTNIIKKIGAEKGEVTNLTLKQYRDLTGKTEIKPNILTPDKKHVKWEYALDETATELGYADSNALKVAIDQTGAAKVRIKALEADIARGVEAKPTTTPSAAIPGQGVEAAGVKGGTTGAIPPAKPPPQSVVPPKSLPELPEIPRDTEIKRIIAQSEEQVRQEVPGTLTRLGLRIPGIKQAMEFVRPGLKMTGENEKVLTSMVAENAAKSDVSVWAMGTRYDLLKQLRQAFGKDALHGGQAENIKFIGTAEQAKNPITGTIKDIADNPELYQLTDAQKGVLDYMNARNEQLLDWVTQKYGVEIGTFTPKEGGAFLPNVDKSEDVIEYLGSEFRAVATGRGKTRVWATMRDRMGGKTPVDPQLDAEKLIWGLDTFKASAAAGQTYRTAIGGLTRAEVIETTHPALFAKWESLRKQLNSLKGSAGTIESNIKQAIYDFEHSPIEGTDLLTLRDALDVKLKAGPRKGFDVVAVQDEIAKVRDAIAELKPSWEAANLKPYTFVKEGLFRYFPGDQAKLIVESRKAASNPLLKVIESWRGGAFSGDMSPFAIQGSIGVLADPYGSLKAGVGAIGKGIEKHDLLRSVKIEALADDIAANPVEWGQYASLMGRQLSGTPGEYAAGWLTKIPKIGKGIGKATEATYITVTRGSFNLWQREFKRLIASGVPEVEAKVASIANASKVFPLVNPVLKGQSPARAALMRTLPTSYSFITQPISLIAQATKGYAKLATFQKLTPQESLAVKSITIMAASVLAVSATSAAISAIVQGKDDDEVLKAMWDAINPDPYNGKFASIIIGDKRIPLGGPYRAIFRALYPQQVKGVPFPVPGAGIPNYVYNRVTPGLRTQLDLWRNQDYTKREIMTGTAPERFFRLLAYEFEGALPLTAGEVVERVRQGERYTEDLPQQVIAQFMGVNMVTLGNTYLERQIRKLGLPQEIEAKPFTINEPKVYETKDFWGDANRVLSSRAKTSGKIEGYDDKPMVKAIIEVRKIKDTVDALLNTKLTGLTDDQWTLLEQRQDLADTAEFDKANSQLANISRRDYTALREYRTIADKQKKAGFLNLHPELDQNPREEWLKSHPDENAKLAIWGQLGETKQKVLTQAAYDKAISLIKELDIPEGAVQDYLPPKEVAKEYFEYNDIADKHGAASAEAKLYRLDHAEYDKWGQKVNGWKPVDVKSVDALRLQVKNRDLQEQYDAITARDSNTVQEKRAAFLVDEPQFARDLKRIDAYNKGLPAKYVDIYAEYYTSGFKGYEDDWYLMEHMDFYRAMTSGTDPLWKERDFSKVPTRRVYDLYQQYLALPEGKARTYFRLSFKVLDDWLVQARGLEPVRGPKGEMGPRVEQLKGVELAPLPQPVKPTGPAAPAGAAQAGAPQTKVVVSRRSVSPKIGKQLKRLLPR